MATVTFDKASRVFPGANRPAVDSLDLKIGDGEFLVLVGPSGCGKSTSLRMLAGLEEVNSGHIFIDDRDVTHVPPKARDIAMVFQNYALYPHMSVYDNMAFALKLRKTSKSEIDKRVKEAAGLLQLDQFLDRKPKALSGGQRQRVAMGRAIVREPQVFLMDEPLSNLDAKLRVATRSQIAQLQTKLGVTTVYVTHDQVEAMTMGHRVCVLLDGVLQQVDTPRVLYDTPDNVFVAGFIGSPAMNIKTVPLTDSGARFVDMVLPLTREQIAAAQAEGGNGRVTVGFRPEDCDLVGEGEGGMPVTVDLVEELGSDEFVYGHAAIEGADERFTVRTSGRHTPSLAETVNVKPRPDSHHAFHAVTGRRLWTPAARGHGSPRPSRGTAMGVQGSALDLDIRLRDPTPGLLSLPWISSLADWDYAEVPLRDIPVGPSRHLVRFVDTDNALWALKELPQRVAAKEYAVLRELEARSLPAVRAAGLVNQPHNDNAILITRYLDRSWQYRRLLMRIPADQTRHRERLLDAMASLLVDLHRNGVFWGDCSLANTLFSRDGQIVQAWLVDAETSEIHPRLSDGQRAYDIDILVENVAGGLLDLAMRLDQPEETYDALLDEAQSVATRYQALWDVLHAEPTFSYDDRYQIEGQIRRLHDLGFAVDEVTLQSTGGESTLRLKVAVAARQFHATQLRNLTGLAVGEGQATILLGDLRAYQGHLQQQTQAPLPDPVAALRWTTEVLQPGMAKAHAAVGGIGDPVQAYCDLLEVRWLLSEQAGHDVGDAVALAALERQSIPPQSAATMVIAEASTGQMRALNPELLDELADTHSSEWGQSLG
jgi:multiple sugar transport system ATP-binding protein